MRFRTRLIGDDICKYKDYLRISERMREEYCTDSGAVFLKDDGKFKDKKGNMQEVWK
jgi:hypothetical protein